MMRLVKDSSNELGIIISSKKNVSNGMTGYSIAHIEPTGLIDRYNLSANLILETRATEFIRYYYYQ